MQYLATLHSKESAKNRAGTPEWNATLPGYGRFSELAGPAIVAGEALQPSETAFTVRASLDGAPLVTDGPFAETTEVIGGYYVLEAESLDDAIELAREIPVAQNAEDDGAVELRPVAMSFSQEASTTGTRYLALIHGKESAADIPDTPEWDAGAAEHGAFIEKHGAAVLGGVAMHPVATATTIRVRDGELLVSDGPFAETAEVIGGLYVLRAPSRDEAATVAAAIPTNPGGAIELRPIVEFG